jgi:hypothetical protein
MNAPGKHLVEIVFLTSFLMLVTLKVPARQNISLKEVTQIDLTTSPGGISYPSDTKKFTVVNEKGLWKSYRLKDSLTKTFVKDISQKQIIQLLSIINAKDTGIKIKQFNIKQQEMAIAFDSLLKTDFLKDAGIKSYQKAAFIVALGDKKRMESMLRKQLVPQNMDDKTRYIIATSTKSGRTERIEALSFANIYNLPWIIDGKEVYNPEISRIYASLSGEENFDKEYKGYMYGRLMLNIFWTEFRKPFAWAVLKEDFPAAVERLGRTLHMIDCHKNHYGWGARFSSDVLPAQLSVGGGFNRPDTILPEMKRLETRLFNLHKQNHYLFKYLQLHPDFKANAIVTENSSDDDTLPFALRKIKAKYKKLMPLRFEEVTFIEVVMGLVPERGSVADMWILLPDDTLIVFPYERPDGIQQSDAIVYSKNGDQLETLTDIDLPF